MARARGRPTEPESLLVAKDPFIAELQAACTASRREGLADERSRAAEDACFRAAAALETFLSEWVIRALSFDTSRLRATYEGRAANEAQRLLWTEWEPARRLWTTEHAPTITVAIHLANKRTLEHAIGLLGRDDDNVPFRDAPSFQMFVNDFLPEKYVRRARTLTRRNERVIDATIAIRRAVRRMNQVLASSDLPTSLRRPDRLVPPGWGTTFGPRGVPERLGSSFSSMNSPSSGTC